MANQQAGRKVVGRQDRKRRQVEERKGQPRLRALPGRYELAVEIEVFGDGWGPGPVDLTLDGEPFPVDDRVRVLAGTASKTAVRSDQGEFWIRFDRADLKVGMHKMVAVGRRPDGKAYETSTSFRILKVAEAQRDGTPTLKWRRRIQHFRDLRFPEGRVPPGNSRLEAMDHLREMRIKDKLADSPVPATPGSCNWVSIGPSVVRNGQVRNATGTGWDEAPISGRITQIAIDPNDTATIFVATAQGGVWKTVNGGLDWTAQSDHEVSLAIGAVSIDPTTTDANGRSTRIVAGTGEANGSDSYYGAGLLISDDGGLSWTNRGAVEFNRDAISSIAIDPADATHMYVSADTGVWETIDDGVNWTRIELGRCQDLVVDWSNPGGPELYVGRNAVGVRRSTDGGTSWTTLGGGLPAATNRVAVAMAPSDNDRLYCAYSGGNAIASLFVTTDGGTTWTPTTVPGSTSQADYNLVIGVHPADPTILLLGEVNLWRSTNSGASWTNVANGAPGLHSDQHAVAFHPTDGTQVYIGNDGGCWYSADTGVTYTHRNKDLATLQYWGLSNHPDFSAVLLGGTQDNGAQRTIGHPAWELSALGDGAFAAIDPGNNQNWYETRWWGFPLFKSTTAGASGSWTDVKGTINTNSTWFYPPFEMDPSNGQILYVGYDELWRSADGAGTWTDVTGDLGGNITAIAVAPSNNNVVYVGQQNGNITRVVNSAGTFTSSNITGGILPGLNVSDIAVDPIDANVINVTYSNLIFSFVTGEHTVDHVFRSVDAGATWANISAGLSQADPVNTIAVDPTNGSTIFIGTDVAVFRSDDAGGTWTPWNDGLPNCSVQDLIIDPISRQVRAATHGRSVWERHIEDDDCSDVDIYVRDSAIDTGRVTPSPSGSPHPYDPTRTMRWWKSVDTKIDAPDPVTDDYQTSTTTIDYLQFEQIEHDNPRRETWVRLHAQVHNRGILPATNVVVRPFFADAGAGLPDLPADFWTAFPADPIDTSVWRPAGPAQTIPSIPPARPQIASWDWFVPADAADHSCMLVVTTCADDPRTTTALQISNAVRNDNNVSLKNLSIEDFIIGAGGSDGAAATGPMFLGFAVAKRGGPLDLRIDPGNLPKGTKIHLYLPAMRFPGGKDQALFGFQETKSEVEPDLFRKWMDQGREPVKYRTDRRYTIDVAQLEGRMAELRGATRDQAVGGAFFVEWPEELEPGTYHFDVQQLDGERIVGGNEYEIRARKSDQ